MTKNLSLVVVILGLFSTPIMAIPVATNLMSKVTLEKDNAKVALDDNQFKQVVEQNFVNTISNKIDHDIAIKIFNQTNDWGPLTGDSSGIHLLRFSISANKFVTGKFKVKGAKSTSFYLNQIALEGDNDFSVDLLNQDYRALLVVSGVERWQDFSIEWFDDETDKTDENKSLMQPPSSVLFGNDHSNKRASMKHYYDSETVGTLKVSPDGELLFWTKQAYSDLKGDKVESIVEIINVDSQKVVLSISKAALLNKYFLSKSSKNFMIIC